MIKGEEEGGREKDTLTMGRREGRESGLLSAAGSRSFYLRCAPAGSAGVLAEDKPPTVPHLDTLGTWSLITKSIKASCDWYHRDLYAQHSAMAQSLIFTHLEVNQTEHKTSNYMRTNHGDMINENKVLQ